MPNHVLNKLICNDRQIFDTIIKKHFRIVNDGEFDSIEFDFNSIIPEPEYTHEGDWYKWRIDNWGTKWNAYGTEIDENAIYFYTAWSASGPVIYELSKLYPMAIFELVYCDVDDIGSHYGRVSFNNGNFIFDSNYNGHCDLICQILGIEYEDCIDE